MRWALALALVGVLWSIVALYYYLVVIKIMYVDHGQNERRRAEVPLFAVRAKEKVRFQRKRLKAGFVDGERRQ